MVRALVFVGDTTQTEAGILSRSEYHTLEINAHGVGAGGNIKMGRDDSPLWRLSVPVS